MELNNRYNGTTSNAAGESIKPSQSSKDFCKTLLEKDKRVRTLCRICYHITPDGGTVESVLKSFRPNKPIPEYVVQPFSVVLDTLHQAGLVKYDGEYSMTQQITLTKDGLLAGGLYFERLMDAASGNL